METIIIKRSTVPYRSLIWLVVVLLPVTLFLYAMFRAYPSDYIIFGIIALVFLLPAIIDFIANNIIPLKAAIKISKEGLVLSSSKGLYDSFAFLQVFLPRRRKLIQWQDITGFRLEVNYKYYTSPPGEGETASTTYSVARHLLYIENKARNEEVIFSVHNLDRTPDEILALCDQSLTSR